MQFQFVLYKPSTDGALHALEDADPLLYLVQSLVLLLSYRVTRKFIVWSRLGSVIPHHQSD